MLHEILLGGVICFLFLIWKIKRWSSDYRKPPGPRGFPLLGNALQLDPLVPHHTLDMWAKKYGDIFTLDVLGKDIYVLNGAEIIHEALITKSSDFAGRPYLFRVDYLNNFRETYVMNEFSERFVKHKKFAVSCMKMYGEHLQKLEDISLDVIGQFMVNVSNKQGEEFDPSDDVRAIVANIMSSMVSTS